MDKVKTLSLILGISYRWVKKISENFFSLIAIIFVLACSNQCRVRAPFAALALVVH
jgi:hypothetical protein